MAIASARSTLDPRGDRDVAEHRRGGDQGEDAHQGPQQGAQPGEQLLAADADHAGVGARRVSR